MKLKLLRLLSGLALLAGGLAGLDLTGLTSIFPEAFRATILSGALILAGSKDTIIALGDQLDDGVRNNSFKLLPFLLIGVSFAAAAMLTSCVTTTAKDGTVTRTPDTPTISAAFDFFKLWAPQPPQAIEITIPAGPAPVAPVIVPAK